MLLPLLALTATIAAGQTWFYPGRGDAIAIVDQASSGATISGLHVERTGYLLARVTDPVVLRALPEVAELTVLAGDGHVVRILPAEGLDEIALSRSLHGRDGVVWSHPDFAMQLVAAHLPDDPYVRDQWHLANVGQRGWTPGVDINAELAWSRSIGKGGLIAIIDTGVDLNHPDLAVTPGYDYVGRDEDPSPDLAVDGAPHGTATSGIAAAIGNNGLGVAGVAYGSSIYAIRMIGRATSLGDFYSAFIEAVDAGAWVLSNSWGYGEKCDEVPDFSVYDDAMAYAETMGRGGLGTAVVFAAGNGNCDIGNNHLLAHPEVIGVAATNGDDRREGYSSFGEFVDIAAPSGTILTTDITGKAGYGSWHGDADYYGDFSGTSASTPVVSGVLTLMFAANPRLTAAQARKVLCETAARIDLESGKYDDKGWSPLYGCGRIDAGAAVMAVANGAPAAPAIVAPLQRAFTDEVVLRWQPAADADGDALTYRVSWRPKDSESDTVVDLPSGTTRLDLTGFAVTGETVTFTVQASDGWGPGAVTAPTTFAVVARPLATPTSNEGGCGCRMGHGDPPPGGALLLAALGLLLRRTRSRRTAPAPT